MTQNNDDVKKEVENKDAEKDKKTPLEKLQEGLKPFSFVSFENGVLGVKHKELTTYLTPKILKIKDTSERGRILARLNGGLTNLDSETHALHTQLATIQVGFEELPKSFDPMLVEDADLIMALYFCVALYNSFFRSTPAGVTL